MARGERRCCAPHKRGDGDNRHHEPAARGRDRLVTKRTWAMFRMTSGCEQSTMDCGTLCVSIMIANVTAKTMTAAGQNHRRAMLSRVGSPTKKRELCGGGA